MNEKTLLLIAFFCSLAGLFALFLVVENLDYSEKTIEKINAERIEDMIKLKGDVVSVNEVGNITFISVMQPNYIDVIVFDNNITLFSGDRVEIIGKGEEYKGDMELIAHRIRVIV